MVEVSVIVPTMQERDEVACVPFFERDAFDDYEVLVQHERGAARARNEGIQRANAEKLVFLDDDSYPCENYLSIASRVLDGEMAVAGRVVHPFDDIIAANFTEHYSHGDEPRYVNRLIGCNMALHRDVFETVGPFDEDFDWGHEEGELAYRVTKAYDIYYEPDLEVRHCYAESVFDLWRKKYRLETRRPLYWEKTGIPKTEQLLRLIRAAVSPSRNLGDSMADTAVKTGANVAATAGRLTGIVDGIR